MNAQSKYIKKTGHDKGSGGGLTGRCFYWMIIAVLVFVVFPITAAQGGVDVSKESVFTYSLSGLSGKPAYVPLPNYQYDNAAVSTMSLKNTRGRLEYIFIDTRLSGYAELVRSFQAGDANLRIIPVRADEDGLAKITRVLSVSPLKVVDALHIVSHAVPGALLFGSKRIDRATLDLPEVHSQLYGTWRAALAEQADILFYGCELAAGQAGTAFVDRFRAVTGADIAASDNLTGSAEQGGDWELERTVGTIEVAALQAPLYSYVLGTSEISGRIKKDVEGNADIDDANDVGIPDVHVYLYRDVNGNNLPDNSDVHYATAVTDVNGNYAFSDDILTYTRATLPDGTYWLVAEVADIDTLGATLEQTYGGAGAMIDPDSDSTTEGTYRTGAGSAFGGRRMDTYDSFSSTNLDLNTAEHIIRIDVNNGTNAGNDFGFGFIGSMMGGYSEFYVPGNADLFWELFESIDNDPDLVEAQGMRLIVSVTTSTDNTTIFYDHWEDGYDLNPDDPYNTADEIRVITNGGTPEIFESKNIPVKSRGVYQYYDFGDRLYITGGPVSVTANMWPESIGSVFANSWELYPIKPFQTTYVVPGKAYSAAPYNFDDFKHVYATIQATEDGTVVTATAANGSLMELVAFDPATGTAVSAGTSPVLNRGESVLLGQTQGPTVGTDHATKAATVVGSKPIQVNYIIGDGLHSGNPSESRGITATPSTLWDDEYYLPIQDRQNSNIDVFLTNANPYEITVTYEHSGGSGEITVPANEMVSYQAATKDWIPTSAVVFKSTGNNKFSAFVSVDSESTEYDWGMNLVPGYILRNEYYLGWAPGGSDYPESNPPYTPTKNYSPAWITPKYDNTVIYIDSDRDGIADDTRTANRFDSVIVRASDYGDGNDNSGLHIWATGPLAVAWGQDSNSGITSSPAMDMGYGVLPLPMDWMDVALGVIKTTDTPTLNFGGVANFSLVIPAWQAVSGLTINDLLPDGWNYVTQSSRIGFNNGTKTVWTYDGNGGTVVATEVEPTASTVGSRTQLSWDVQSAPFNIRDLDPNDYVFIEFRAKAPVSGTAGLAENESTVCGKRDLDDNGSKETTFCSEDNTFVYLTPVSLDKDTKSPKVDAGKNVTFTIAIKNDGVNSITGVTIGDILPDGFTYNTNSVSKDAGCGGSLIENIANPQEPEWSGITVVGNNTCTITYTVTVASDTPAGIYDSDAWLKATTINQIFDYGETGQDPGTIITSGVNQDPEKDEDVEVIASDLVPNKAIIATSDNGSNGYAVGIGEIVRYRLQVQLPEASVEELYLLDNVQQGQMLIEDSVRVSIIDNDNDLTAVTYNTSVFGSASDPAYDLEGLFDVKSTGTSPYRAVIHKLPDDNLSTTLVGNNDDYLSNADDPAGTDVYFKIGDITNPTGTIDNAEYVVIEYNALVLNIPENQNGTSLDNFFTAYSASSTKISNEVGVTVTEPLVNISKNGSIRYVSGGAQAVYTITVSNLGTVGAYDLHITDQLDTSVGAGKLDIDAFSDIVFSGSGGTVTGVDVTATDPANEKVDIVIGELPAGATAVFTITADLVGVVSGDSIAINRADLTYTSLPGDQGPAAIDNPTESQTPDVSGRQTGERNGDDGSGGLNDFADSDDAPLMTYSPPKLSVDKSSSAGGTVNPGDTITYTVNIENTGGSPLNNVVVTDAVPTGTTYVSGAVSGYQMNRVVFRDDFHTGGGYNQSGGTADWSVQTWTETNDDGDAATGVIRIANSELLMKDTRTSNSAGVYLSRIIPGDLTGKKLFLEVDIRMTGTWEPDDVFSVEVYNGSKWLSVDPIFPYSKPDLGDSAPYIFDLFAHANANTQIRFYTSTSYKESIFIDYVKVYYSEINTVSGKAINPPPAVINSGDNFYLAASDNGGTENGSGPDFMTMTYQVTVDTPVIGGLTSIDNTVRVTADELLPGEVTDTVSDDILGSIGDLVWNDLNGDGVQDAGEPGIAGVTVELYQDTNGNGVIDGGDSVVTTKTTAGGGLYDFTGLAAGDYIVYVTDTGAMLSGSNLTGGTNPMPVTGLTAGQDYNDADFGYQQTQASIGDLVWNDLNGDGVQDAGEPGIDGVTVDLYQDTNSNGVIDGGDSVVATKTTAGGGAYDFTALASGDYIVDVTDTGSVLTNFNLTGGTDPAVVHGLTAGQDYNKADFGYQQINASIGDLVWNDLNGDGVQDAGEPGIDGVTVDLYQDTNNNGVIDGGDSVVATKTTAGGGAYDFTALASGDYIVDVTDTGSVLTNFNLTGGTDPAVVHGLTAGQDYNKADFGYQQINASIGDLVWNDLNGNGVQDAGEPGIDGVTVDLYQDTNNNGLIDAGDINLGEQTTAGGGLYDFTSLAAGNYVVDVTDTGSVLTNFNLTGGTDPAVVHGLTAGQDYNKADFGYQIDPGTIGDRVWLDENGDGVQDAGEAGIPNLTVELRDSGDNLVSSAVTGDNGEYIFTDVPPGDYIVRVVSGITDLHNTYDKDDRTTNPNSETNIIVTAGKIDLTADFGYNWVSPVDTDTPAAGATGAIGDRIWNDADGDGIQDPGEAGIKGVTVTLLTDNNGDGVYDNAADTAVTDATGRYIFDNLTPGSYVVEVSAPAGTTQTGDPDEPGVTAASGDNRTTAPIILAPGDVYVNADFGYKAVGSTSTIGDRIYLDVNGDGTDDGIGTEPGFAGVTVALKNGSGKIIAYDVTDKDGKYLFPGLPSETYTVEVTDTRNVLGRFTQTGDPDGSGSLDSKHTLATAAGTNYPDVDFGYAPEGHGIGEGLIGDTIFLDRNNNNTADAGEGIEGVTVKLYDSTGATLLATAVTDANGRYEFGNLNKTATYQVHVDTATLPNGGIGLSNSVDPESDADSRSTVDLNADADGIVLDRDFGYQNTSDPNTISGTIWDDTNADGVLSGETGVFSGVTVLLRDKSTGNIVATAVTDANGSYSFGELPDDTYTVDVVDTTGVLDGYWHSVGPDAGDGTTDNNSQADPYTVTVGASNRNDNIGDFGYYRSASAVGDLLWEDANGDGMFDSGSENPIPHHKVTLMITYPNGDIVTLVTKTNANGKYSFSNLLADENYQSSGANQPTYVIQVDPPAGMASTHTPATDTADADNQADNPEGEFVALSQGEVLETKDFGFRDGGSIGDYVWLDIDGDGVQDNNEPPLGGVTVKLYRDGGNGLLGGDDSFVTSVNTALDGRYMFENLSAGTYWVQVDGGLPAGLEVTGDSNHGNTVDQMKPADKVVLAANGSHDTADFGFTSPQVMLGDTVWFDANNNGTQDSGEVGISGVKLYICDGNEANCDSSAAKYTVTTDIDGTWLKTGLNSNATYTVSVDTSSLPSGINQTPTNNGGKVRTVYTLPASGGVLFADYGFKDDAAVNYGTIGDRVYFDTGNNKTDDGVSTDPGIAGVLLDLLVNDGGIWKTVAQTTTAADGRYLFSGLVESTEYKVQLNSTNSSLDGLTGTQQPADGAYSFTPSSGTLNKDDADFGFFGAGIGDYVWFDINADGVQDANESGISGVEVKLYLDNGGTSGSYDAGDTLVRSTTTDSNGKYLFTGLATGQNYVVKITPPSGFTSTTGGNEKAVLLGSATDLSIDFGLKGGSYSIGDKVWFDTNKDGNADGGEIGINGVTIDLYLNGVRIATTVTAGDGAYNLNNLPSNNNYEVRITDRNNILANVIFTTTGGNSQSASVSASQPHSINNFGVNYPVATYATVSSFNAYVDASNKVVLEWTTASEIGTIGFLLERLNEQSGKYRAITKQLLPGMLSPPHGGTYRYVDKTAKVGTSYTYRVLEVAVNSQGTVSDPYTVKAEHPLPTNERMFADGPEGYTLTHQEFSKKQLRRFAVRDVSETRLAAAKKKQTGTTLKVPVSKDGLVHLSAAELAAASGLSEKQAVKYVKSKKCLVTLAGTSVPVIAANTGSGFWFYGRAPERNDIGQNIYLLELGEKGVKMKKTPGRAEKPVNGAQSFTAHIQVEENHQPFHLYINTPVKDFWAWEYLIPYPGYDTVTHTLNAPYSSGHGSAVVTVNLVGVMSTGSSEAVPYKVAVSLNDVNIGTAEWSAVGDYQFRAEVPADLLSAQGNEVKLLLQLNSGITYSLIYFESFELDYERDYRAEDGELVFSDGGYESVTVRGFSSSNVLALDITDPDTPVRVRTLPGKNDFGEYTVTVRTEPGHEYFITENIASAVSGELVADKPSDLKSSARQADYLVISPLNLTASAERLVQLRESQGLKSMLVDIEDIQDEFSNSLAAPEAVHDFLAYVYEHWTQVPKYVVLIGDGSYDYRNYLDYGYPLVPSLLVQTPDGFFPSDNAFADVVGNDRVPEFAVGRIPAVDSTELDRYIDKLIVYEQSLSAREPLAVVVTDRKDLSAGDFRASGDKVAALMPEGFAVQRLNADVDTLGESGVHNGIATALKQGADILHYIGHSSLIAYGRKNSLLTADDIDKTGDIGTPMLMVSMACSTASFGYPPVNSIGESAVLKADGAAVGFYGATGLSFNYQADIIAKGFYTSLFDPANTRVGDAVVDGKQYYSDQGADTYTLDIYNLLGDPAMTVPKR